MRPRSPSNVAHSVHQRLLNLARSSGRPFNEVLQHYTLERFLYRMSRSPDSARFVLKGALMQRVWAAPVARPTMDIDLLIRGAITPDWLETAVRGCLAAEAADDGIAFDPASIAVKSIRTDGPYHGWRVQCAGRLGNARLRIQLDVATGDAVVPEPVTVDYPVLLDMPLPVLVGYPPESSIAEKVHAMVILDMANSRMKDFYDIALLARTLPFEGTLLTRAIRATFERRRTPIPIGLPAGLTAAFCEDPTKQVQWSSFLRKGRLGTENETLVGVVDLLRGFVQPPLVAAAEGSELNMVWPVGGPWQPRKRAEG